MVSGSEPLEMPTGTSMEEVVEIDEHKLSGSPLYRFNNMPTCVAETLHLTYLSAQLISLSCTLALTYSCALRLSINARESQIGSRVVKACWNQPPVWNDLVVVYIQQAKHGCILPEPCQMVLTY